MSDDIEGPQIEAAREPAEIIIEGMVENGAMLPVAFPFYTGPAGVRDRGNGRVDFAFFRPVPLRPWRSSTATGTIGDASYQVVASQVSGMTKAMIIVSAQII